MPDPVIVPPTPTVVQPTGPVDNSPGLEQVQHAFDRVYPEKGAAKEPAKEPVKPPPQAPPEKKEIPPPEKSPVEEVKIPSFLKEALGADVKPPPAADEDWPEELPQFKTSEEARERYRKWRGAYDSMKGELKSLRDKPAPDTSQLQRMSTLENQNKQMSELLSRMGVEHSPEFQHHVMQPLYQSWNEAARIVKDAGGDPQELAKAMSLTGKSQFEALDNLFSEMPESAKLEAHDALRSYRRFEEARRNAVANAPKTLEGIRAREIERHYQQLTKQHSDMQNMFERALTKLRDEAKVEVFQKTNDPESKWWNEQSDQLVQQARNLFLENTDMDKVAFACLLAPAAEAYRKLFIQSQKQLVKLEKLFKDKIGNEPTLSESGGTPPASASMAEDLKKPFSEVFLREFHRSQERTRR